MKRAPNWIFALLAIVLGAGCGDDGNQGPRPDAGTPSPTPDAQPGAPDAAPPGTFDGARAHWLRPDTIVVPADMPGETFELHHAPEGGMRIAGDEVTGGQALVLTRDDNGLPDEVATQFPHLAGFAVLKLPAADVAAVPELVAAQLALVSRDADGALLTATGVQTPGVLDALYAYDGPLGLAFPAPGQPTFRLWAPTARAVTLHVYDAATKKELAAVDMTRGSGEGDAGVWTYAAADDAWYGHYYKYEVEVFAPAAGAGGPDTVPGALVHNLVTDPYSVGLATNSAYSLIVNLADPATMPPGWDELTKPALEAPEDVVLYEAHIRDFSVGDVTVAPEHRGKYLAFTYDGAEDADGRALSNGMQHLQALAEAGLTHVHLLPAFDIATIDEDVSRRIDLGDTVNALCAREASVPAEVCSENQGQSVAAVLEGLLASLGGDNEDIQALVGFIRDLDAFNWGYDPFHYTAPEGSYATNPEGMARIVELRAMVQGLSQIGLRTVMDVVYNHTNASGQSDRSVLDRIVPGYYHRRNAFTGEVERSTCCENTATEHAMMEKLMIDSVLTWARDYKVDGFRFDLMGHHMKSNMERVLQAVQALTPEADGVEGAAIYVYGEGWDFGEVLDNARGENAVQENMAGSNIGTFSDRLRDAVRGGGPFDGGEDLRKNQGFANGLFFDPNDLNEGSELEKTLLIAQTDLIRVGLAGNLRDFVLVEWTGDSVAGSAVSYNGYPAGYTADPQEVITYVTAHDNQTLWDINQYKIPTGRDMATRVRIQNMGLSIDLLAQGVPFLHMGAEMLRSKSMERDSFDSGDWFNRVDFTYESNNWNVGLPRKDKDGDNYELIGTILDDESIAPQQAHIEATVSHVQEMLRIRKSTPLFRLRTGDQVASRVDFHNTGADQVPGLVIMSITDGVCAGDDLDGSLDGVVVLFNANDEDQVFAVAGTALADVSGFELHALQQGSSDTVVQGASFDGAAFRVPARTTAVFVLPQVDAQGEGLPCNTREAARTEPGGTLIKPVFIRGTMNDWGAPEGSQLQQVDSSTYAVTLTLEAGSHAFKTASEDWGTQWGSKDATPLTPGSSYPLAPGAGDIHLDIATAGDYRFTLDTSSFQEPVLTVAAAN